MANNGLEHKEKQALGGDFRAASARGCAGRKMGGMAAFLGGVLLVAFGAVADISPAQAHNTPAPPSTEDIAKLELYPNAGALRLPQKGEQGITGLHELAESGALGMVKSDIAAQLQPSDMAITDKAGRRVAEQWVISKKVQFANPAMKDLLRRYSEGLNATEQLKLASLVADYDLEVFSVISINKLQPGDIVKPIIASVPVGTGGQQRIINTNLLLDTIRNRIFDKRMQALAANLTPQQKMEAALAVDEVGGTLGHYIAQDTIKGGQSDLRMINEWKDYIQWAARDVTGLTPLQQLANRPDLLAQVFTSEDADQLLAVVMNPDTQKAREAFITSHEILNQSDPVLHTVVTPDFLLSSPDGDGRKVIAKLRPECLVQYFAPRVMGHWSEGAVESVWAEVDERYKHDPAVRKAHRDLLRVVRGVAVAAQAPQP